MNIIQGPLAGVSCAPFRLLTWRYSRPAFSCSEMMSCKTLIHQSHWQRRFIEKDPNEGPVCFQLSGNNLKELAEATQRATDYGADLIDLNCGCPVKKIRHKGAGSRLLADPMLLYQLIIAMKQQTHLPVSVKIRVDGLSDEKFNQDIAKAIADAGPDFLVVHGRHWSEDYHISCHYAEIQFFVEQLKIPVIGNGDIACVESLKAMLATGCAGVMIARAGMGQPWLIRQLIAQMQGGDFIMPSLLARGGMFLEHVERLSILINNEKLALFQARKFAKYYAREQWWRNDFCQAVQHCDSLAELRACCELYFAISQRVILP